MKKLTKAGILLLLLLIGFSCQKKTEEPTVNYEAGDESSALRMPFNQKVFLLNSANGKSTIYEVGYDFQGLTGNATLTELVTSEVIPNGGHMCVSPDNRFLTVVVAKKSMIYLVEIATGDVKSSMLLGYKGNDRFTIGRSDLDGNGYQNYLMKKVGGITQVDVDQQGYLFIAGKAGFFRVVSDIGNRPNDPSTVNTGKDIWTEIWNRDDNLPNDQNWVHAFQYKFRNDLTVESTEDGEEYFDDVTPFNPRKVRFQGGDILFTQNAIETDGFEKQRLISFSQWKGGSAIYLNLEWDYAAMEISFDAGKIFGSLNAKNGNDIADLSAEGKTIHKRSGRVTGAALTGDNMVMTSHHKSRYLQLRTLDGEIVADDIKMVDAGGNPVLIHNWGDMASTQTFDKVSSVEGNYKELSGHWSHLNMFKVDNNHQYAEVKLYRPENGTVDLKDITEGDEYYDLGAESRDNSANADIADYRYPAKKFVHLEGGLIIMKFPSSVPVNPNTVIQLMETTWNGKSYDEYEWSEYEDRKWPEKADVYVSTSSQKYIDQSLITDVENNSSWVNIASAHKNFRNNKPDSHHAVNNNNFYYTLSGIDALAGEEVNWVAIIDKSEGTPAQSGGFDVNFVAAYTEDVVLTSSSLPCEFYKNSFFIRTGDDYPSTNVRGGEPMYRIPTADQVVPGSIRMLTQTEKDYFGRKSGRSAIIGVFAAEIDGKLHAYEIHDDCSIKGMRHFEWGGSNKNASFVPLPKNSSHYDMSQVTTSFIEWDDDLSIIYDLNGETKIVPFAQKQEARIRYSRATDYNMN